VTDNNLRFFVTYLRQMFHHHDVGKQWPVV